MEKSENMKVDSIVAEPKAEVTEEDLDEAWLDDLLIHLSAMEQWNDKKNASKVLMGDPMFEMPSQDSHWKHILLWYPLFLCFGGYGTENSKTDVPPQENTEPGGAAGSDKKEAEMGTLLKNPGTQTKAKTTRDVAIQVCMKGPRFSGKCLAKRK